MGSAMFTGFDKARIDIKNQGENNDVKIIVVEGGTCRIDKAEWFSKNGEGYTLSTSDKHFSIDLQCVGSGELLLRLLGINKPVTGGGRLPLWIDYTRLDVNKEIIFWEIKPQWHDKPYVYTKKVMDGEKVNVEISWSEHSYKGEELVNLLSLWDVMPKN